VPWLGDLVGVAASCYILAEASRLGVGRSVLVRMALNVAIEGLLGAIPLLGDVFDAAWKANQRNVRLLAAWLERPAHAERTSLIFVMGLLGLLLAAAMLPIVLLLLVLRWLGA